MNSHDLLQPFKRVWDGWHCWLCSLILTFPMQQGCERGVPVLEYSHNAMDLLWKALKPQHNLRTSLHFELWQTIRQIHLLRFWTEDNMIYLTRAARRKVSYYGGSLALLRCHVKGFPNKYVYIWVNKWGGGEKKGNLNWEDKNNPSIS